MKGQYDIMGTNQKSKLKKNLLAAALVILMILTLFACMRIEAVEKELAEIKAQLISSEKEAILQPPESQVQEEVPKQEASLPEDEIKPVMAPPLEVEKPEEVTAQEPEAKHKVYLTFDDGPSKNTEKILDILDEYGVKATFFVVGKEEEIAQERLRMIYERGHTIGMHSYTHDYYEIYDSVEDFRKDFLKCKQYIFDATGVESTHFRFPGGSSNKLGKLSMTEFIAFLEEQGVEYYDWNISSGDGGAHLVPVEVLLENCTAKISRYDTSIILMHDSASKTTTVEALPQILETILAMKDTAILPITENTQAVHHVIRKPKVEQEEVEDQAEKSKDSEEVEENENKEASKEQKKATTEENANEDMKASATVEEKEETTEDEKKKEEVSEKKKQKEQGD